MKVFLPASLTELWQITGNHPESAIMAGGTDLLVRLRAEGRKIPKLVCLERIEELQTIEASGRSIRIGSAATLTSLLQNETISEHLPVLHRSIAELGSPLIRNMATMGGNICSASPAGDTLPALYVLKANLVLKKQTGERTIPIDRFFTGPGQTILARDEILHSILITVPEDFNIHHFEKVGQRKALAISIVSFAALLHIEDGMVQKVRMSWGSVGPTIVHCREAEKALTGRTLSPENLEAAAHLARKAVIPISDIRADAHYRRQVAGNLLLRLAALNSIEKGGDKADLY